MKFIKILAVFSILFLSSSCASRTKIAPCSVSDVLSCSVSFSNRDDIEQCVEQVSGSACQIDTETLDEIEANITSVEAYSCNLTDDQKMILDEKEISTTFNLDHAPSLGQMIFVDMLKTPLVGDYQNFSVVRTIQTAIDLAKQGDTIFLCPGTYFENVSLSQKTSLTIKNFDNGNPSLQDVTVIQPVLTDSAVKIEDSSHILIKGITVQGANAMNGAGVFVSIFSEGQNIKLQNMTIQDNFAVVSGGGIYIEGIADVSLKNVILKRNSSVVGGAVYIKDHNDSPKTVFCEACDISENKAVASGTAISVGGNDGVVLVDSKIYLNFSDLANIDLSAIFLNYNAFLYAQNLYFGQEQDQNIGGDIFHVKDFSNQVASIGLLETFQIESDNIFELTQKDLFDYDILLLNESLNDPGLYDFSGELTTLSCNLVDSDSVCVAY